MTQNEAYEIKKRKILDRRRASRGWRRYLWNRRLRITDRRKHYPVPDEEYEREIGMGFSPPRFPKRSTYGPFLSENGMKRTA